MYDRAVVTKREKAFLAVGLLVGFLLAVIGVRLNSYMDPPGMKSVGP